ncbi:MAG: hypothetical protein M3153_11990 [Chloroflexota bacterium]|nr:hypothetical protein [Chloroflexota bacterium]
MQNAVIGIIVGVSFIGLTLVAMRSGRRGSDAVGIQLILGVVVGALAAAIAVSVRADLVPDDVEATIAIVAVVLSAIALILIVVRHQTR